MKLTLFSCLCVLFLSFTAAAQKGGVKIKVKDEDNLNLPGATIDVKPGKHTVITDKNGEAFIQLSSGSYNLSITYIGYGNSTKEIKIGNEILQVTEVLKSGAVVTDNEVIVLGDRLKGQAKALNQQRNSGNITNIVSADQIGRFPDANIGDAIKRVPGITMQNDQGEARNIVIRGMGPEFNAVTLNGERVPSAEGDNRRVQMDLIPADMVQTVEVNKTLTADMDADAIGGSVNLVTRSAPNGLRISGTLAGGYSDIRQGFNGTANLLVGTRTKDQRFGFIVNGSYNTNKYGSDNVEAQWSKDANGKEFISDHDVRVYDITRIRRSISSTVDLKINPRNTIYLTGTYNWRDDRENRYRLRHRTRTGYTLQYDADGEITGYTGGEVLRQTKGGLNGGRTDGGRLEDQRVRSLALNGDHFWGKLKTNWSIQYAKASEERPNERYIAMRRRGILVSQDIQDAQKPLLTDNQPLSAYDRIDELTEQFQNQFEKDLNAKLNFELPVSIIKEQKGSLYFGGRVRSKSKERANTFFEYEPVGANEDNFANMGIMPLENKTNNDFLAGKKYTAGQFVSKRFLGGLDFTNPSLFSQTDVPSEYLAGNYTASENIYAGFIGLKQNFTNKFSANIGVRVEHTYLKYTGNIVEDEETLKGQNTFKDDYTDVLPSVNLKYNIAKDLVLKAAYTHSIARPKYYDLVPYFLINPADQELEAGNPALKPVRSKNVDLMVEKYFKSVGLISGGVFYKKLDNFYFTYIDNQYNAEKFGRDFPEATFNPIGAGEVWRFTQRRNGSGADVMGFEIAAQRQLDFLPGIWKGFGVYANYTYTYSKTEGIYADGEKIRSDVKLPGAAPHMFNASLSYENSKLVVRVSGNFTSAYVDDSDDAGYGEDSFNDRYYDKQFFLDVNASYAFNKKFRLFAEANNLTNQGLRYYQGAKNRTAQMEYYGPRFNLGVKFDLTK